MHTPFYAGDLDAKAVMIPLGEISSAFSACGVAIADVVHVHERSINLWEPFAGADIAEVFAGLTQDAAEQVSRDGVPLKDREMRRFFEVRYVGQLNELIVEVGADGGSPDRIRAEFERLYVEAFGPGAAWKDAPVEIVGARLEAAGLRRPATLRRARRRARLRRAARPTGRNRAALSPPPSSAGRASAPAPICRVRPSSNTRRRRSPFPPAGPARSTQPETSSSRINRGWAHELGCGRRTLLRRSRTLGGGRGGGRPQAASPRGGVDFVTDEVLSHRLWHICDEAGVTIRHVSGSPAATEANDFMTVIANEMAMSPS